MRTLSALLLLVALSEAHEAPPSYHEITETAPGRYEILWRTPVASTVALRFPEDAREVAQPTVRELPDARIERHWIEKTGGLGGARIEFPGLGAADVLVRVQTLDGRSATMLVNPSRPWVEVRASTGLAAVMGTYVLHGIQHISFGVDHLLFVLGLLLIVRDRWMLVKTVTAFTVAHSITLAIATLGYASAPVEPLNAAVALSILFLGPEVVRTWRGGTSFTIRHPWVAAFAFGLVHGFGFAGALTGAGLPPRELPVALLGFNVGVEIGQVAFVLLVLALERSFRQLQIRWSRWASAIPGYAVGSLGAFWTIQTTAVLMGFLA
ncbi:MAG: HupE/UreJ family protein [Planctomycetota bacterium]